MVPSLFEPLKFYCIEVLSVIGREVIMTEPVSIKRGTRVGRLKFEGARTKQL